MLSFDVDSTPTPARVDSTTAPPQNFSWSIQSDADLDSGAARDRSNTWPQTGGFPDRSTDSIINAQHGVASFAFAAVAEGTTGQRHTDRHGLSFNEAVMTMIINCVGVVVVLLPKVMADIGIVLAPILALVCCATCLQCGVMVSTACSISEDIDNTKVTSYEALANIAGGPGWKKVLMVTKNVAMLGFIIAFMQFVVDSLVTLIPGEHSSRRVAQIRFFVVMPVFCALSMITTLRQLVPYANLGLSAVIVKCLCMIVGSFWVMSTTPLCSDDVLVDCRRYTMAPTVETSQLPGVLGKYLAIFLFCFAVIATVPSIRSQLANPAQMHPIMSRSFKTICFLDIILMAAGYLGFGQAVPENIIDGLAEALPILGNITAMSMIVNCLVSAPLFIFCVVTVFESSGNSALHTPMTIPNIGIRVALIVALTIINAVLPYVTEILGLISSVFACCNNVLFPCTLHFLARRKGGVTPQHPTWRRIKYNCSLLIGLLVLVFGFQGSLDALLEKINDADNPTTARNVAVS